MEEEVKKKDDYPVRGSLYCATIPKSSIKILVDDGLTEEERKTLRSKKKVKEFLKVVGFISLLLLWILSLGISAQNGHHVQPVVIPMIMR